KSVLEKISKKRPADEESDASDLDGEVIEYSDHETDSGDKETDSQIDVEDNPVHEEYSDSNVKIIHSFNLHPLIQMVICKACMHLTNMLHSACRETDPHMNFARVTMG
ncbi:hypothetical protein AVEN_274423-2-1, partial [Araneus ventricosus]